MRARNLTPQKRQEILTRLSAGEQPQALAIEFSVSRNTIYGIRHKAGQSTRRLGIDHVALQQQSMAPPEVYCHRAGIQLATLRSYCSDAGTRPALGSISERRTWWRHQLMGTRPETLNAACIAQGWPLIHAVRWMHDLYEIHGTWLYGPSQPIPVPLSQQALLDLQTDAEPSDHVLVNGRSVAFCPPQLANHMIAVHHQRKVA